MLSKERCSLNNPNGSLEKENIYDFFHLTKITLGWLFCMATAMKHDWQLLLEPRTKLWWEVISLWKQKYFYLKLPSHCQYLIRPGSKTSTVWCSAEQLFLQEDSSSFLTSLLVFVKSYIIKQIVRRYHCLSKRGKSSWCSVEQLFLR